uniref:BTB domain-containing protein n=1 Tax=Caenorhabditis tropicalis TaxID=1561998 RepID=A0A1I7UR45_9PELO
MEEDGPSGDTLMNTGFDVKIEIRYTVEEDKIEEETVFAHRLVLSTYSPVLQQLLNDTESTDIKLDLSSLTNSLAAFKVVLQALYTGDVKLTSGVTANEVLAVSNYLRITALDAKIAEAAQPLNLANLLPFLQYPQQPQLQNYLTNMINIWSNPFFSALLGGFPPAPSDTDRTQSEGSSPRANSTATPPDLEKIVPNDDKEGWCRNKKYIEKVDGGFMCTVCRKIYGRYNSVSYHVTIYHRNPPIKCEENGCNFSTREARYIHFHKYYRHHIPLPENIDLGSRKCPFCRHVSKSPAMLEKHIARHETDGASPGALKRAQSKKKLLPSSSSSSSISEVSTSLFPSSTPPPIRCSLCPFSTNSTDLLFIHLAMQHTRELAQSQSAGTDSSSETSTTSASSDGEQMMTELEMDVKPMIDQSLILHLNTPLSN